MMEYQEVILKLFKARKIIIISGAGISTSSGIPDFRSTEGLYSLVQQKYPDVLIRGSELFDASLFKSQLKTKIFYSFIGQLMALSEQALVTPTHDFYKYLNDQGKVLRIYTQNIDDLDLRAGMACGFAQTDKVIQLHGDLQTCKCTFCSHKTPISDDLRQSFLNSTPLICPVCKKNAQARIENGKREIKAGMMRPNIVLYNEHHPNGDTIAKIQNRDLRRGPDMLIVMGTSLKIPGVKVLLKRVSELVKENKGISILINHTRSKEFDSVFDYQFTESCDTVSSIFRTGIEKLAQEALAKKENKVKAKVLRAAKIRREEEAISKSPISKFFPTKKIIADSKIDDDKLAIKRGIKLDTSKGIGIGKGKSVEAAGRVRELISNFGIEGTK